MKKITIVGAGLLGRLIATTLYKNNLVTLIDPKALNDKSHTGHIAAAMVAPVAESAISDDSICAAGKMSISLWPSLLSYLGIEDGMSQLGTLVLAHQADKQALANFLQRIEPSDVETIEICRKERLLSLEPELSSAFTQGHFIPSEAHINNDALYLATSALVENSNIRFVQAQALKINQQSVQTSEQTIKHDLVLDCRGSGARQELTSLRGVRGEVIRVYAPEVTLNRPIRLMHPRYPLYIVPKKNQQFVIGATEIESDDEKPITVRSTLELLSAAYSIHSGFAEAQVLALQTGLRPAFSSNKPHIFIKGAKLEINGLYRHGYLLTPVLIKLLLSYLTKHYGITNDWLNLTNDDMPYSQWISHHD